MENSTKKPGRALAEFQHKFGIYVDGVAGLVTSKVMRFLDKIDYGPDTLPVSEDHRVLIQAVARSQTLGIALIGNYAIGQRSGLGQVHARLKVINRASQELVKALDHHPLLQGAEFPEDWTPERAIRQANSIRAELVLYLDVLDTLRCRAGRCDLLLPYRNVRLYDRRPAGQVYSR